jgi:hypothetical protein
MDIPTLYLQLYEINPEHAPRLIQWAHDIYNSNLRPTLVEALRYVLDTETAYLAN